jgi:hypothetical protein
MVTTVLSPVWPIAGMIAALVAIGLALGCADFSATVDPTGGAPDTLVPNPSFVVDVSPIFEKRCATGGCHSIATHQVGLTLDPTRAYESLVGVPSALQPPTLRVRPSEPDQSWLVTMIRSDDAARRGFPRMPLATHPLTENQIATIVRWIEQGALRN